MNVLRSIILLCFLAICLAPRQAEAQAKINDQWSKLSKCGQVGVEAVAKLISNIIPAIYEMQICSFYTALPPKDGNRKSAMWYIKNLYRFFKKLVLDKPKCLKLLVTQATDLIKPYSEQIEKLQCLEEKDYIF
ncbi:accessory gland protein Acp53Ea [Drosophila obscura]|uniref:accessory gland protein Acp53Ea n=1 Tax=Drosophila obscura TaxID=7282 RepID=UPI000BA050CF|nr:accessory gland protein Acp53Ea [Drosophila obscura]